MSQVVVVRYADPGGSEGISRQTCRTLLATGLQRLSGQSSVPAAVRKYLPSGVIGLKTNCLARQFNSTPVTLTDALVDLLVEAGFSENDTVVWERTGRELAAAGYTLNAASRGRRCLGTDTRGVGYSADLYTSGEVGSLVSRILTDMVDFNINIPVLKDHSIAGLSAGLKNMYGAVHNPNKYHDNNCDPYCAHVNNLDPIRRKTRLTVLAAMQVQYQGGPGYVGDYMAPYGGLLFSDDPVAVDRMGLEVLEYLRKKHGRPSLANVKRPVKYLDTAQQLGLGVAELDDIEIRVVSVDSRGHQSEGKLL
ncbi:MAG: DUF362 domain-containing protein [bacterium]